MAREAYLRTLLAREMVQAAEAWLAAADALLMHRHHGGGVNAGGHSHGNSGDDDAPQEIRAR